MSRRPVDPRFGGRLRELREMRGMKARELARAVPCSHVYILQLERGAGRPSPHMAARIDDALGAAGELAALTAGGPLPGGGDGWHPMIDHFGRADAEDLAAALVADTPTPTDALRLAHEWLLAEPPQIYELRVGRRISHSMVATVEQRIHQLRRMDDHVGGSDSYTAVASELAATADLLREASCTEVVGRRLLAALGELAQLTGWVAADAGRHHEAQRYYLAGARAAHAGGDTAGAANNLSSLAYHLTGVGNRKDAVMLACTATAKPAVQASGRARVLLLERAAWAHARAGDAAACERLLSEVDETFERPRPDDPGWVYWLNLDEVQVMAGRCWTELQRPLRAVPVLRQATTAYGEDRARETALYLSWLAEALLQAREVDEAAATALRTLLLARKSHSTRAVERTALLYERMLPWRGVPAVDEFADAYRTA